MSNRVSLAAFRATRAEANDNLRRKDIDIPEFGGVIGFKELTAAEFPMLYQYVGSDEDEDETTEVDSVTVQKAREKHNREQLGLPDSEKTEFDPSTLESDAPVKAKKVSDPEEAMTRRIHGFGQLIIACSEYPRLETSDLPFILSLPVGTLLKIGQELTEFLGAETTEKDMEVEEATFPEGTSEEVPDPVES